MTTFEQSFTAFLLPDCTELSHDLCAQEDAGCVVKVGIHAIYGAEAAYSTWNATFEQYLSAALYPDFNCTFTIVPLLNETAVYDAVGNATIDLIYANSGMHVCLEVRHTHLLHQVTTVLCQHQLQKCCIAWYKATRNDVHFNRPLVHKGIGLVIPMHGS